MKPAVEPAPCIKAGIVLTGYECLYGFHENINRAKNEQPRQLYQYIGLPVPAQMHK